MSRAPFGRPSTSAPFGCWAAVRAKGGGDLPRSRIDLHGAALAEPEHPGSSDAVGSSVVLGRPSATRAGRSHEQSLRLPAPAPHEGGLTTTGTTTCDGYCAER